MAISTFWGNKIIDHMLRNQAYSPPATVYASVHTGDPALTGANEATGGSYARQAVTLGAAASRQATNSAALDFTGMPAGTFTNGGLWDAPSGGNFLIGGTVTSKTLSAGDTYHMDVAAFLVDLTKTT